MYFDLQLVFDFGYSYYWAQRNKLDALAQVKDAQLDGACRVLGLDKRKVLKFVRTYNKHTGYNFDLTYSEKNRQKFFNYCKKPGMNDGKYKTLRDYNTSWQMIPDHLERAKKALLHHGKGKIK